jgi:hypothetical protein
VLLLTGRCSFPQQTTAVKVILNPEVSGWYFIQMTVDTNSQYQTTTLKFRDTTNVVKVSIKDVDNTVVSVFDSTGNDLSDRLKYSLSTEINTHSYVIRFYNPTAEELEDIVNWLPSDKRAEAIYQKGTKEFNKRFIFTHQKIDH